MGRLDVPMCDEHTCFGCKDGHCQVLTESLSPCGFYKTKDEVNEQVKKSFARLMAKGHNIAKEFPVLWEQYRRAGG